MTDTPNEDPGAAIHQAKARVIEDYGPWTNDSIHLGGGVYTHEPWLDTRLRRVVQVVSDVLGGAIGGSRVLDLAFLEGQLGIEFALQGAEVTGIEGREANLAKARFARDVLKLDNYKPMLGDVRDLGTLGLEPFDVVLCAGILYHLEAGAAARLVHDVAAACRRVAVIDTHFSLQDVERFEWEGESYWGRTVQEHRPDAAPEEVDASLWYSLDNRTAFYFTRDSLANLLRRAGFTSVFDCLVPYEYYFGDGGEVVEQFNRNVLVAIKGDPVGVISSPVTAATPELPRPERSAFQPRHAVFERAGRKLDRLFTQLIPTTGPFTHRPPRSWRQRPSWKGSAGDGANGDGRKKD
jgi:hypothetical protein